MINSAAELWECQDYVHCQWEKELILSHLRMDMEHCVYHLKLISIGGHEYGVCYKIPSDLRGNILVTLGWDGVMLI